MKEVQLLNYTTDLEEDLNAWIETAEELAKEVVFLKAKLEEFDFNKRHKKLTGCNNFGRQDFCDRQCSECGGLFFHTDNPESITHFCRKPSLL